MKLMNLFMVMLLLTGRAVLAETSSVTDREWLKQQENLSEQLRQHPDKQLQHRVSGGLHVVIDEPTQCRRNAVLPGFVQHPLQPLFRYREGDKVQRPFCRLFLIRRFLLADQIIDKLAV